MKKIKNFFIYLPILFFTLLFSAWIIVIILSYGPDELSSEAMQHDNVRKCRRMIVFQTTDEAKAHLILYQGGLVRAEAYAFLAQQLVKEGIQVYVPKMPLQLAITNRNVYEDIMESHPLVEKWWIAGHSLGGATAAYSFHQSPEQFKGLILLAAYGTDNTNLSHLKHPILSVTASNDEILNQDAFDSFKNRLPVHTLYTHIEGGNHAGFGDYGFQRGDGLAELSVKEQQLVLAQIISNFIHGR